jgi:glycosyltransferase involved in cell wall biosynthesis
MDKRVLLLGISFNDSYGAGVTLRNLFSLVPPENIGVVDYCVTFEDFNYAKSLYRLGKNEKSLVSGNDHKKEPESKKSESLPYIKSSVKFNFKLHFLLSLRKYLAYYYNNYSIIRLSNGLENFISSFKPDYIYVIPYNRRMINFALKISRKFSIPIVSHFMDDYRNRSPRDPLYFINESLTLRKVNVLVENSCKSMAICESMAEEYQKIFLRPFVPFHNPINTDLFHGQNVVENPENRQLLNIVYTGTIAENNIDTLISFSSVCEKIHRSGFGIKFDIYSPTNNTNIFFRQLVAEIKKYKAVNLKEKLEHAEIIQTLFNYNLLLLPLTFTGRYKNVIKVSFPTKVAEYMASGVPILFLIPEHIALHEFVTRYRVGYLIDELKEENIESFLTSIIDKKLILSRDETAIQIAFEKFDIMKVSENFAKVFSS